MTQQHLLKYIFLSIYNYYKKKIKKKKKIVGFDSVVWRNMFTIFAPFILLLSAQLLKIYPLKNSNRLYFSYENMLQFVFVVLLTKVIFFSREKGCYLYPFLSQIKERWTGFMLKIFSDTMWANNLIKYIYVGFCFVNYIFNTSLEVLYCVTQKYPDTPFSAMQLKTILPSGVVIVQIYYVSNDFGLDDLSC